jgi:hypothetical protein
MWGGISDQYQSTAELYSALQLPHAKRTSWTPDIIGVRPMGQWVLGHPWTIFNYKFLLPQSSDKTEGLSYTKIFVSLVFAVTLQNEASIQSFHLGGKEAEASKVKYLPKNRNSNLFLLTPSQVLYMINSSLVVVKEHGKVGDGGQVERPFLSQCLLHDSVPSSNTIWLLKCSLCISRGVCWTLTASCDMVYESLFQGESAESKFYKGEQRKRKWDLGLSQVGEILAGVWGCSVCSNREWHWALTGLW